MENWYIKKRLLKSILLFCLLIYINAGLTNDLKAGNNLLFLNPALEVLIVLDTFPEASDGFKRIYQEVDEMPRFPGCEGMHKDIGSLYRCADQRLLEYVYRNIRYPREAREKGIEGQLLISFVVSDMGFVESVQILQGIGGGSDEEVIRVIYSMNEMNQRWIPGKIDGKAVYTVYYMPVRFSIR